MSDQRELVYNVLKKLEKEGVLKYLIVVGGWCVFFYRHHFKEAQMLPPIRTRDIEFDVSRLKKVFHKVDISATLKEMGFIEDFQASEGFVRFLHQDIIIEFLAPETGRGQEGPYKLPGFGINAQTIRYLNFLEEEIIAVKYKDLSIIVPHPAIFAIHKLIVSERRPLKNIEKSANDVRQALAVLDML